MVLARDELEAPFDVGSDADMEDGEEEDGGPRLQPVVLVRTTRTLRARSVRAAAAIDRSLMLDRCPAREVDSTSSNTVVSRTGPVRDPWMPTPSEIQSRFGSTAPPSQYALYSCNGIIVDDATTELDFDPETDQRRDYYIGLFHELRWYGNKKTFRRSRVPNGRHAVKAGVLLLITATKTPLATVSVFA
ncbi:unnamed protein product [Phytophthora fragariaefolia]|uniref:Unnamed protein product n=1 Tax=Phytophthora fragariaefolia TaxID=1490495 RepID=A0A9W7DA78_9STRA|nr:unnamed protein product [Phytophthora fragariaefolia]